MMAFDDTFEPADWSDRALHDIGVPVCPACGERCTSAELAAYRKCESCYVGGCKGMEARASFLKADEPGTGQVNRGRYTE